VRREPRHPPAKLSSSPTITSDLLRSLGLRHAGSAYLTMWINLVRGIRQHYRQVQTPSNKRDVITHSPVDAWLAGLSAPHDARRGRLLRLSHHRSCNSRLVRFACSSRSEQSRPGDGAFYMFVTMYGLGIDSASTVFYSEIFPNHLRAKCLALATMTVALTDLVSILIPSLSRIKLI